MDTEVIWETKPTSVGMDTRVRLTRIHGGYALETLTRQSRSFIHRLRLACRYAFHAETIVLGVVPLEDSEVEALRGSLDAL